MKTLSRLKADLTAKGKSPNQITDKDEAMCEILDEILAEFKKISRKQNGQIASLKKEIHNIKTKGESA